MRTVLVLFTRDLRVHDRPARISGRGGTGDVASKRGNWQWVACTGADARPNRILNPLRRAIRFDPRGDDVRRYVPELAGLDGAALHRPWTLGLSTLRRLGYPPPIVDLARAVDRFRRARAESTRGFLPGGSNVGSSHP